MRSLASLRAAFALGLLFTATGALSLLGIYASRGPGGSFCGAFGLATSVACLVATAAWGLWAAHDREAGPGTDRGDYPE